MCAAAGGEIPNLGRKTVQFWGMVSEARERRSRGSTNACGPQQGVGQHRKIEKG